MAEDQETQNDGSAPQQPERVRAPNYQELYVNQSEFGITPWDMQIMLGRIQGKLPEGFTLEELVMITMSPHHAKAFMMALAANVRAWEQSFGEIQLPQAVVKKAGAESVPEPEAAN